MGRVYQEGIGMNIIIIYLYFQYYNAIPPLYPPDETRFGQAGGLPHPAETGRGCQLSDQSRRGCGPQDTHGKCYYLTLIATVLSL